MYATRADIHSASCVPSNGFCFDFLDPVASPLQIQGGCQIATWCS